MPISATEITRRSKIKSVPALVAELRSRADQGHYNYMSFKGQSKLLTMLNECETYARESHSGKKHNEMEKELRAMLDSSYG